MITHIQPNFKWPVQKEISTFKVGKIFRALKPSQPANICAIGPPHKALPMHGMHFLCVKNYSFISLLQKNFIFNQITNVQFIRYNKYLKSIVSCLKRIRTTLTTCLV